MFLLPDVEMSAVWKLSASELKSPFYDTILSGISHGYV